VENKLPTLTLSTGHLVVVGPTLSKSGGLMIVLTRSLLPAAMMLLCSGLSAAADPIVAIYDVRVTERRTGESFDFLPFERQFTLRLTFDPAIRGQGDYGPARFSPLPLPSIAPPPGLPLETFGATGHGSGEDENPFNLFATAIETQFHAGPTFSFNRSTRLLTNMRVGEPRPPFSVETFPAHLVLAPINFFHSASLRMTQTSQLVGSVQYRGSATLLSVNPAQPIPEPGTLALVGTGVLLLARRRRHARRRCAELAR
jgi:hypothetical protein